MTTPFKPPSQPCGQLLASNGDITSLITSGDTVTLNPANDFHPGELVLVTATVGIENAGISNIAT